MKKILYFLLVAISTSLFSSCDDDETVIDYAWKDSNEAAFEAKGSDPDYQKASIDGGPGYIYYKVLEEKRPTVAGEDSIAKFTSVVRVYYKGQLIDGTVFDDASVRPFTFKIDGSSFYLNGASQTGSSVISGWQVALQNMKEGDVWEVWIPWTLGYGSSGSGSTIPAYSTLVFQIKLDKMIQLYPLPQDQS